MKIANKFDPESFDCGQLLTGDLHTQDLYRNCIEAEQLNKQTDWKQPDYENDYRNWP